MTGGGHGEVDGRDFSAGVPLADFPAEAALSGRVGDQPLLVSRFDGRLFAVSGVCTHYGAMLASGLVDGDTVRCPLHHACFSLKTGAALRAPALDPLQSWQVDVEQGMVYVRDKQNRPAEPPRHTSEPERVVIVGGGAAGLACANELRVLGYAGSITMLSADADPPVDRPNLSKDYLAGKAPEEWMPLRPADWYAEKAVDLRLGCEVVDIDIERRSVRSASREDFPFDRLLLATGSEPNRLAGRDFEHRNVFTLRSFADARNIIRQTGPRTRAVIVGSSFIGLEAAAALRARDVEVDVISPESVPFEGVFGSEVGRFLRSLHERNGVRFRLRTAAAGFNGRSVALADGTRIEADMVLVGIGVRPRTGVAVSAGLSTSEGVRVDAFLETAAPGVYAAGDIATYPDPVSGQPTRIEHWVTAQRQGQTAAANMLGLGQRYDAVPFFWTEQYGVALRYVGDGRGFDEVAIAGDVESGDFIARYFVEGVHRASAAVGHDVEILEDERRLESMVAERALFREPEAAAGIKCAT